jgi:hypothetical protein
MYLMLRHVKLYLELFSLSRHFSFLRGSFPARLFADLPARPPASSVLPVSLSIHYFPEVGRPPDRLRGYL